MIDYTIKCITNTIKILIKVRSMTSEVVDIRERIEKMRIKFDVEQNENLIPDEENKKIEKNTANNLTELDQIKSQSHIANERIKNNIKSNKTIDESENSFPSVSLSVKNPISSKMLVILMILQIFSNLGILFLLYSLME